MKQNAKKTAIDRHILRRMTAGYLLFAVLVILALTVVAAARTCASNLFSLRNQVSEVKAELYSPEDVNGWHTLPKTFGQLLKWHPTQLAFPSKLFFCDDDLEVLAESAPLIDYHYSVPVQDNSWHTRTLYVPLAGLTDEQLLEIDALINRSESHHGKSVGETYTEYSPYILGHREGDYRFVASRLMIKEETWKITGENTGLLVDASPVVATYELAEPHPEDEWDSCRIYFERHGVDGIFGPRYVYDRYTQQALHHCQDAFAWVQNDLRQPYNKWLVATAQLIPSAMPTVFVQDMYIVESCAAAVEGQSLRYIIATGRAYPMLQAARQIWPIYIAILAVAVAFAFFISWQLSQLSRKQQNLEDSRQALLVAVAHELKNPLSVIKTYSEGLLENISEDKRDDYLQTIIDETEQMDKMIVELLSLTRLTSEGETMQMENIALSELIDTAIARYAPQIDKQRLHLHVACQMQATVKADRRLLEQALANLLANAITYTPVEGAITITADESRLSVANQGPTIDEAHWQHLFEPFYKIDSSRNDNGGVGLGLAIVQAIAKLHGMRISGHNLPDGVCFTLDFDTE